MYTTRAWTLAAGGDSKPAPGHLEMGDVSFGALEADEVLVEPLLVGWEGNCYHAVERQPIDVCRARGEARVVVGNSGVVRVLKWGARVTGLREGETYLMQPNYRFDRFGYGLQGAVFGYDAPGTVGLLAKRTKVRATCLVPLPPHTRHSLAQWTAFAIRYVTAFANWRVALGAWRLQVTEQDQAVPHVWGWGGGTTFAELALAKRCGAKTALITSRPARIALAAEHGLGPIDRREFPYIEIDPRRARDPGYSERHHASMKTFLELVRARTDGEGVSIFVDYLGEPVVRATLKALAREGVVTSAGWREGMRITFMRAIECIERHQHVHTHYARRSEIDAAMEYGERTGWMPPLRPDEKPYAYEQVPDLVASYASGDIDSYFPMVQVNTT